MGGTATNVCSIATGLPFVDVLAAGVLARHGAALELAEVTILLPTRRACRSLREAFLRQSEGQALLLPAIQPIGEVDAEELLLESEELWYEAGAGERPISGLRRQLLLSRLIMARDGTSLDAAQAAGLARELAVLIDQMQTERLDFAALADIVPAELAEHWQLTLDFLAIVTETWPGVLAAEQASDPAAHRNRLLEARIRAWHEKPPSAPVIAAGSTGSIPASADLLHCVARLPAGCVVLPGLDQLLDAEAWQALDDDPGHPQFGLRRLLAHLGVERADVMPWNGDQPVTSGERLRLITEALKPAAVTAFWPDVPAPAAVALDGFERLDCPAPLEEARTIALLLRHALEVPGRTAALVTPDRGLARRVAAELGRWGLEVDDSAGQPLAATPPGVYLRLVAALLSEEVAPLALLAALKHPLAAGGIERVAFLRRLRRLEHLVLRGPRPAAGFAGLRAALSAEDSELSAWLTQLEALAAPMASLLAGEAALGELLAEHVALAEALAATDKDPGAERLWAGEAGETAARFVAELAQAADALPPIAGTSYAALFDTLLAGQAVRPRFGRHPRLFIWGLLEARLQSADLIVLGGLNEGTWPPAPRPDPWLSRPMRAAIGLPEPERRIGLTAHDFVQAAAAPKVVLTRADKVDGTPTVPSRWLLRIEAFLDGSKMRWAGDEAPPWLFWQDRLDGPAEATRPSLPPAPRPPLPARPRTLAVTDIETWIRDPYALYAKRLLGLKPLQPIDADPGAAERGVMIHQALELFLERHPKELPENAIEELLECGREAFGEALARPGVLAFWWPRFERIAAWVVAQLEDLAAAGRWPAASEVTGEFRLADHDFSVRAKADRIDRLEDGGLAIVDYKTGGLPKAKEIKSGSAPQLALEALIAEAGGFAEVDPAEVALLSHWRLSGGDPAGEVKDVKTEMIDLMKDTRLGLERLVVAYDNAATPYRAKPRPALAPRWADYDHLARVREWSGGGAQRQTAETPQALVTSAAGGGGATPEQRQAAEPETSVWVSASAGTGKTRVLTDRVLRLMLAGTRPENILCLTFTKAAAAEMANRLNRRLGRWAMLGDDDLTAELGSLTGQEPATLADDLPATARRLFARVLDARGGLKIQTIHAFCESLLGRFPLEAGLMPHFQAMDERSAAEHLGAARDAVLATARGSSLEAALAVVTSQVGEDDFAGLLRELAANRGRLGRMIAEAGGHAGVVARVRAALELEPGDSVESLRLAACQDPAIAADDLGRVATAQLKGSATDQGRGAAIRNWLAADSARRAATFDDYLAAFFTKKGTVQAKLPNKAALKLEPDGEEVLGREAKRLAAAVERCHAAHVAASTAALLAVGEALLAAYETTKRRHALLDYDDLILATRDMLGRPGIAEWVLYKLDSGLDHILIDEAQDTNPEQWEVVEALANEFFVGMGAREQVRTIFAVGDAKQSIYGFQRADPEGFVTWRQRFGSRAEAAGRLWDRVDLEKSFRSNEAVLGAVDAVFAQPEAQDGLLFGEAGIKHQTDRRDQAGLVEVWPLVKPTEEDSEDPWTPALEQQARPSPEVLLAGRIADCLGAWLARDEQLESRGRALRPGDVMILVQRRNVFFEEMVRALKQRGVPVAGADRMVLTDQLAVMDLVALGRFALLPDDDLSLAELLKSPLVGLDDDDLFALAWQRPGSLWQALTVRREEQPAWQEAWQFLSGLLAAADYVPPYEFYARVLGRGGGRRRLQARLGSEVNDPIDEFLALALHFERLHAPALEAFLHWLAAGEAEVKRDLELGRDEVRVLTVHGAKGLQAPVVFLPDTCRVPSQDDRLLWLEDGERELLLWPVRRKYEVGAADAARQAARQSRLREYRRLLYVAMTRAEDRLYVAGWETSWGRGEGCWYDLVWQGLEDVAESVEGDWGEMRRLVQAPGPDPDRLEKVEPLEPRGRSLPDWATRLPAAEPHPPAPLAPSRPEEEPSVRAPLGADNGLRFRRGNLVHRLLQSLPEVAPEERQRAATRLLEVLAPELAADARAAIAGETLAVLETPDFAPLFGPGSKAEVPLTARLGDQVLSGQVDRLCVSGDEVLLVDYKTNRPPPDSVDLVAPAYLRQLAAYRAALEIIYPDRTIRCALLWTDGPRLMEIEGKILVHWMP